MCLGVDQSQLKGWLCFWLMPAIKYYRIVRKQNISCILEDKGRSAS